MKILLVDTDKQVLGLLQSHNVVNETEHEVFSKEPRLVAAEISKRTKVYEAILINAEGQFGTGSSRQQFKGIEVVFWLRLKHKILTPIILYGFHSAEQILAKQPENLILLAPANRYVRLPFSMSHLDIDNLHGLTLARLMSEYVPFVKPAFNLGKIRHQDANWWGIKRFWDVRNLIWGSKLNYPKKVLDRQNTIEYWVLNLLYGLEEGSIEAVIKKHQNKLNGDIRSRLIELDLRNEEIKMLPEVQADITELEEVIYVAEIAESIYASGKATEALSVYRNDLDTLLDQEEKLLDSQKEIPGLVMETYRRHDIVEKDAVRMASKEIVKTKPPGLSIEKILHIDDLAKDGWGNVFRDSLYHEEGPKVNFFSIDVEKIKSALVEKRFFDAANEIKKMYGEELPSVILLDLKLVPAVDDSLSIDSKDLSGLRLLQELKKVYVGTPILVTTASNKVWNYQKLESAGADGYWVKEGPDEIRQAESTVLNYVKLISLVKNLTHRTYNRLTKIERSWGQLKSEGQHWWREHEWGFEYQKITENQASEVVIPSITYGNNEVVFGIVEDAIFLLKTFLKTQIKRGGMRWEESDEWFVSAGVIRHLGNVVEHIHDIEQIRINFKGLNCQGKVQVVGMERPQFFKPNGGIGIDGALFNNRYVIAEGGQRLTYRGDRKGLVLYNYRNAASHYAGAKNLKLNDAFRALETCLEYLSTEPRRQGGSATSALEDVDGCVRFV